MTNKLAALLIISVILVSGCTNNTIETTETTEKTVQQAGYPRPCRNTLLINETCALLVESTFVDTLKCPGRSQETSLGIEYESFSYDNEALALEKTTFTSGCETTVYQKLVPKMKGDHLIVGHLGNNKNVTMGITIE